MDTDTGGVLRCRVSVHFTTQRVRATSKYVRFLTSCDADRTNTTPIPAGLGTGTCRHRQRCTGESGSSMLTVLAFQILTYPELHLCQSRNHPCRRRRSGEALQRLVRRRQLPTSIASRPQFCIAISSSTIRPPALGTSLFLQRHHSGLRVRCRHFSETWHGLRSQRQLFRSTRQCRDRRQWHR